MLFEEAPNAKKLFEKAGLKVQVLISLEIIGTLLRLVGISFSKDARYYY